MSSTAPVAAFVIWICSLLPWLSQSIAYRAMSCAVPSVRFTFTVKLVVEDQAAATRPVPPRSSRALGSVVLPAHVVVASPAGITVA